MSTALITGASSGIGSVYARRLAARGHNLVLVARSTPRIEDLAAALRAEYGVEVETLTADLTVPEQLALGETRLRSGTPIDILVNNAGAGMFGTFADAQPDALDQLIKLNITAPTRLASAAIGGMVARASGSIINIGSVVGFMPEQFAGIYSATKAYILTFSQGLSAELGPQGIYVQAVLPAATRTDIWEKAGIDVNHISNVMGVDELVEAALSGYDQREAVTIPPLGNLALWQDFETARATLPSGLGASAAERYKI